MSCALDSTKVQQDDGSMRGIEITPEGCQAVSEDVCASGYMAPAGNVTFPLNSLKQCCKCKEGEACPLCVNPNACTDEEKDEFVTVGDCFGNVILGPSEALAATTGPSPELSETEINASYIVFALMLLFLLLLAGYFLLSRRTKTI
jgi:hypothetical protein